MGTAQRLLAIAVVGACARSQPSRMPSKTTPSSTNDTGTYEIHPYYVNFIPFGAGQFQNGETSKGIALLLGEGVTVATSVGIWLYLSKHYQNGLVPSADASRVRTLQNIGVGTGIAFIGLYAAGIFDSMRHYRARVRVNGTAVTIAPMPTSNGGGVAFSWSK